MDKETNKWMVKKGERQILRVKYHTKVCTIRAIQPPTTMAIFFSCNANTFSFFENREVIIGPQTVYYALSTMYANLGDNHHPDTVSLNWILITRSHYMGWKVKVGAALSAKPFVSSFFLYSLRYLSREVVFTTIICAVNIQYCATVALVKLDGRYWVSLEIISHYKQKFTIWLHFFYIW